MKRSKRVFEDLRFYLEQIKATKHTNPSLCSLWYTTYDSYVNALFTVDYFSSTTYHNLMELGRQINFGK